MNIGNQILNIRQEHQLTQEDFGKIFHVTRQTVSNWENEKSYPDLQTLVEMSDQFQISLDVLLKENSKMVQAIDKERILGTIKHEKSMIDALTGAGTGIVISCFLSPASNRRIFAMIIGIALIGIGWCLKARYDKKIVTYVETNRI